MYSSICLIGLGSFGSFLARTLVDTNTNLKKLTLIDYDTVTLDNIGKSLYDENDVGRLKIDAIYDKIKHNVNKIVVDKMAIRFGSTTTLPICDLVIDCRDFRYDKFENIPAIKTYISSRKLIVDCRNNIIYENNREGSYSSIIHKHHLLYAAAIVSNLINGDNIQKLIDKNLVQEFELDYLDKKVEDKLNRIESMPDVIYDYCDGDHKLLNLLEYSQPIISTNKNSPITVYVGGKDRPTVKEVIPPNRLSELNDLMITLIPLIQLRFQSNYYIVSFSPITPHGPVIELIPDDGSA